MIIKRFDCHIFYALAENHRKEQQNWGYEEEIFLHLENYNKIVEKCVDDIFITQVKSDEENAYTLNLTQPQPKKEKNTYPFSV